MSDLPVAEEFPVFQRVSIERVEKKEKVGWDHGPGPNDHLTLVFDTETTTDVRQALRFGIAQLYAEGRLAQTWVLAGELRPHERETVDAWALERGAEVMPVADWVRQEFLPMATDQRAVVVGFNLPFDVSRIAADWEPKKKIQRATAWTLSLIPRSDSRWAFVPRIQIQHVSSALSFISLTGTKGKFRTYRGAFVDGRTFAFALTGEKHSLKTAGEAFGCDRKKAEQDYHGPVNRRFLDYCLNDVELTVELYSKCKERYAAFGIAEHPSRIYSPASLAKAIWKASGVRPPQLSARETGRIMSAFYAGKVESRVRGREVEDIAVLDFTSQYPSLYCLLGAEHFLTAARLSSRDSTEEVRAWVEGLNVAELLRRETWQHPLMWSLCEVEAHGETLPIRSTYDGLAGSASTIGWNLATTEPGLTLPYMVADVLAAKLLGESAPKIVRASTFEPVGRQEVRPVNVLGIEVGPAQGVIQTLAEARIREKRNAGPGSKERASGLKTICNAGSYGIFVEVNRKLPRGKRGKALPSVRVRVHGLGDSPFELEADESEDPGSDYCPLVGATLTSAAHLLLAAVDTEARRRGAEIVYCDTDSAFITPSRISGQVAGAFAALNPYSLDVPFLKDETEEKAPVGECPKEGPDRAPRFFGLSSKRYCLFARDGNGRARVFRGAASDHGLGSFQAPSDRKDWVAGLWERIIEKGEEAAIEYAGVPATSDFSLTTPSLLPRVQYLPGVRPFNFLTARLLEPSKDPNAMRSELVAYIGPKDTSRRAALMDLPRQRSWGSVVEAFVRHRDRKCTLDSEGRAVRRHVFVRERNLVGLGKEANRLEASRVLGLAVAGGRANTYLDADARVLAMGRAEAMERGLPWSSVTRWKRRLKAGGRIKDGHGGRAHSRLCNAISVSGLD